MFLPSCDYVSQSLIHTRQLEKLFFKIFQMTYTQNLCYIISPKKNKKGKNNNVYKYMPKIKSANVRSYVIMKLIQMPIMLASNHMFYVCSYVIMKLIQMPIMLASNHMFYVRFYVIMKLIQMPIMLASNHMFYVRFYMIMKLIQMPMVQIRNISNVSIKIKSRKYYINYLRGL